MLQLLALLLPLSLDTLALAAAIGMLRLPARQGMRLSLVLAGFEAVMPLVGVGAGRVIGVAVASLADYIACAALVALGAYVLVRDDDERDTAALFSRAHGLALIALGIGISLDELAIGFSVGLLHLPVVWAVVLLAVQAFAAAQLGLRLGARLGQGVQTRAEQVAGVALVVLGLAFVAERAT